MSSVKKSITPEEYLNRWDDIVWSYSRVSSFYNCPHTWKLTYLDKIESGNYFAFRGTAVHECMEDLYNYLLQGGKPLSNEVVRDTISAKFANKMLDCPYPPKMYFRGKDGKVGGKVQNEWKIINSIQEYIPRQDILHVEREIFVDVRGYKFRCLLDAETDYSHIDYKSSWSKPNYFHQQVLYGYAKSTTQKLFPKFFDVCEYNNGFKDVRVEFTKLDVKDTFNYLEKGIKDIRKALEDNNFPKKADPFFCLNLCRGCELGK